MADQTPPVIPESPPWGPTIKMAVGLVFAAIIFGLLIYLRSIVGPLILAFILTYLIHPIALAFKNAFNLPWRTSVTLIYLVILVVIVGVFTLTGLAAVNQVQNLVVAVRDFVTRLPDEVAELSQQVYEFGPFTLDLAELNMRSLVEQALGVIQPLLGQAGTIVATFATSAATIVGWTLFVLLISYFLLAEGGQVTYALVHIDVPGYTEDIQRMGAALRRIWDSFLRGQIVIIFMVIITYALLMMLWGVRYSLALAILAGLARLVPYIGPWVSGSVTALVAYFQDGNRFDIGPLVFTILVLVSAVILDTIFDNVVTPRFMGQTLGVHPAAVLISAIVATRLIGLVGLLLAAPVLATLQIFGRYIFRKMFDLPLWPPDSPQEEKSTGITVRLLNRLRARVRLLRQKRPV
jgi:predicted PurR-regulated permease PerM